MDTNQQTPGCGTVGYSHSTNLKMIIILNFNSNIFALVTTFSMYYQRVYTLETKEKKKNHNSGECLLVIRFHTLKPAMFFHRLMFVLYITCLTTRLAQRTRQLWPQRRRQPLCLIGHEPPIKKTPNICITGPRSLLRPLVSRQTRWYYIIHKHFQIPT